MIYFVLGILLFVFGGLVGAAIALDWVNKLMEDDFEESMRDFVESARDSVRNKEGRDDSV